MKYKHLLRSWTLNGGKNLAQSNILMPIFIRIDEYQMYDLILTYKNYKKSKSIFHMIPLSAYFQSYQIVQSVRT